MNHATLIALLCERPELADQLVGGTIALVRHHLDHATRVSVQITVPINVEGTFTAVPVVVDIDDPTAARETFRDFEHGRMNWVESDAFGAIALDGVVDSQDRVQIVVVPTAARLRITFLREAGIA